MTEFACTAWRRRRQFVGLLAALALAACGSTGVRDAPPPVAPAPAPPPFSGPPIQSRDGMTPPFMANRAILRIGLLLPFAARPDEAHAIYQAAELAVFDFGDPATLLIPRESGATVAEAANNARLLLRDGADIILGPLQREAVMGAGQAARERQVPVVGFSTDRAVVGGGVYMLSLPLDEDVRRIVEFAMSRGLRNFALLTAESDYGKRVEAALRNEVGVRGGTVQFAQFYQRNDRDAATAARLLAQQIRGTPVQAILVAENGAPLRAVGPALLIGGVTFDRIKLLGTSEWARGDAQREPTLAGGWYAAPDPALRAEFEQRYRAAYGNRTPARIASLGYDAVMTAIRAAQAGGADAVSRASLERPEGFAGADGIFRFRRDGSIERGLAVLEVRQQGAATADPAPRTFRLN